MGQWYIPSGYKAELGLLENPDNIRKFDASVIGIGNNRVFDLDNIVDTADDVNVKATSVDGAVLSLERGEA
eukprot:10488985-Ditylum_brightwellii.AAC.1